MPMKTMDRGDIVFPVKHDLFYAMEVLYPDKISISLYNQ